jgi:hypothetical protein
LTTFSLYEKIFIFFSNVYTCQHLIDYLNFVTGLHTVIIIDSSVFFKRKTTNKCWHIIDFIYNTGLWKRPLGPIDPLWPPRTPTDPLWARWPPTDPGRPPTDPDGPLPRKWKKLQFGLFLFIFSVKIIKSLKFLLKIRNLNGYYKLFTINKNKIDKNIGVIMGNNAKYHA